MYPAVDSHHRVGLVVWVEEDHGVILEGGGEGVIAPGVIGQRAGLEQFAVVEEGHADAVAVGVARARHEVQVLAVLREDAREAVHVGGHHPAEAGVVGGAQRGEGLRDQVDAAEQDGEDQQQGEGLFHGGLL